MNTHTHTDGAEIVNNASSALFSGWHLRQTEESPAARCGLMYQYEVEQWRVDRLYNLNLQNLFFFPVSTGSKMSEHIDKYSGNSCNKTTVGGQVVPDHHDITTSESPRLWLKTTGRTWRWCFLHAKLPVWFCWTAKITAFFNLPNFLYILVWCGVSLLDIRVWPESERTGSGRRNNTLKMKRSYFSDEIFCTVCCLWTHSQYK